MIPKYKWMRGYFSPYVPGWDTHGLPIELRTLKDEGLDKDSLHPIDLRRKCKECADRFLDIQRNEFKRLGVIGDWNDPYITFKPEYEAIELEAFAEMVDRGYVYRGQKPIYWCTDCQTALAAAEIEYEDISSPSIYVAYPLKKKAFPTLRARKPTPLYGLQHRGRCRQVWQSRFIPISTTFSPAPTTKYTSWPRGC